MQLDIVSYPPKKENLKCRRAGMILSRLSCYLGQRALMGYYFQSLRSFKNLSQSSENNKSLFWEMIW